MTKDDVAITMRLAGIPDQDVDALLEHQPDAVERFATLIRNAALEAAAKRFDSFPTVLHRGSEVATQIRSMKT